MIVAETLVTVRNKMESLKSNEVVLLRPIFLKPESFGSCLFWSNKLNDFVGGIDQQASDDVVAIHGRVP